MKADEYVLLVERYEEECHEVIERYARVLPEPLREEYYSRLREAGFALLTDAGPIDMEKLCRTTAGVCLRSAERAHKSWLRRGFEAFRAAGRVH